LKGINSIELHAIITTKRLVQPNCTKSADRSARYRSWTK